VRGHWRRSPERGPLALDPPEAAHGVPAAFLDRDGVINEGVRDPDTSMRESPLRVEDVHLLPGVVPALRALASAGYALVCVTNQPAAAKGKLSLRELRAIHERVLELLEREGIRLDASRLCPHHPDGVVHKLSGPCSCRKPASGMLLDAARVLELDVSRSWMLGDTDSDVIAGTAAGCRTALIEYPGSAHKRADSATPTVYAGDLVDGVAQLLAEDRN
jgi:D-glycero-D-manno-heptose 1,7-bisphosphate phosphatase